MTAVLPELDAETVEEMRPPCDALFYPQGGGTATPCPQQAQWVSRIRCDTCRTVHEGLLCDTHKGYFFDHHGPARCIGCTRRPMPYTCLSVERL